MTNISEDEQLIILIKFINQTLNESREQGIKVNTVSTLWIILFALILVQKVFKYIVKPMRRRVNDDNDKNNVNRDESAECIII